MKKVGIILAVSFMLIAISATLYLNSLTQDNFIYPGISVDGVDISGFTVEQARAVLQERVKLSNVSFICNEKKWEYNLGDLGFEYDYDKSIQEAFAIGRSGNVLEDWITIFRLNHNNNIDLKLSRNDNYESFGEIFSTIRSEVDSQAMDASVSIVDSEHGGGIFITPEKDGYEVDIESLKNILLKELADKKEDVIIKVPVKVTHANVKKEQLSSINGIIGEFTTTFNANVAGRSSNIKLASSKVDSVLVMPGQEFSFNNATGAISIAAGYKNAPVIVKGELQEGIGGGVCQVSTTLYNSVLYAGLDVLQRRSHSIPSTYVAIGRDAAVSYGALDLVFKNPHDYPVYIKAFVTGNKVTARVYGDTTKHINKTLSSEVVERIPRQVKYVNDPSLPLGKEVVDDPGRDGVKSVTYESINGQTNVVSRDHYPARAKVVRVGTGPAEVEPSTTDLTADDVNNSVVTQTQEDISIESIIGGRQ